MKTGFIMLNETTDKIFDRYAELLERVSEVRAETPEAFETIADLEGELRGIKFVVNLLANGE